MKTLLTGVLALSLPVVAFSAEFKSLRNNDALNLQIDHILANKTNSASGLQLVRSVVRPDGTVHNRYKQLVNGVPVFGEDVIINIKGNERKFAGAILQDINLPSMKRSSFSASEALELAKKINLKGNFSKSATFENESSELMVFVDTKGAPHYAYVTSFVYHGEHPTRPFTIINAETKEVLDSWEGLAHHSHLDEDDTATGPGGNKKTSKYMYGVDFEALKVTKNAAGKCVYENSLVKTIDLKHKSSGTTPFTFDCGENTHKEINGAFSPVNDAHFYGEVIFKMYKDWFNTAPLTFKLTMRVHYSTSYENAFWDGSAMTFGDGKNMFYPLVSLDVSAHEISHGFTEQNSSLVYKGMSGGMNESFSDIAGEAAEYFMHGKNDFMVGAEIFKAEGKGLRYFEDPTKDGKSIGHASKFTSSLNVHYSSGVFNRAFYLLANTEGWDVKSAFAVFVKANQDYWTASSTFEKGACGVQDSAKDLGLKVEDVAAAFATVGVTCK